MQRKRHPGQPPLTPLAQGVPSPEPSGPAQARVAASYQSVVGHHKRLPASSGPLEADSAA
ncbi:MAG: hypothetical protein KA214_00775 [Neisseriaceae bacterium]|nr:hypothetical protein [Neisseriaceae bacterium]